MAASNFRPMGGPGKVVEVDEAYHGKSQKINAAYRHNAVAVHSQSKVVVADLPSVLSYRSLEREAGSVRSFHVPLRTRKQSRRSSARTCIAKAACIRDESKLYTKVGKEFAAHETVNHGGPVNTLAAT